MNTLKKILTIAYNYSTYIYRVFLLIYVIISHSLWIAIIFKTPSFNEQSTKMEYFKKISLSIIGVLFFIKGILISFGCFMMYSYAHECRSTHDIVLFLLSFWVSIYFIVFICIFIGYYYRHLGIPVPCCSITSIYILFIYMVSALPLVMIYLGCNYNLLFKYFKR